MNPNNSRPMSYESLKTLLQHAKPNLRFELSRRIPSIRLTEKAVPTRIHKLFIGSHGVEVNDTYYEARTIRHFPPAGIVPRGFRFDNESHDGEWDLDKWGFDDFSSETVFTPGDLVLQAERQERMQWNRDEERKKELENELKFVEWIIAKKSGENVEPNWTGEAVNVHLMNPLSSTELKSDVERLKIRLAPYNCFENNIPLPFTKMVQVTIRSTNRNLCWRYSGNLKYYEVQKQLMAWLLGNRKHVIHVNHLIVTNGIIARLPENLRICIKTLQTGTFSSNQIPVDTNTLLRNLAPIIHNDNRPLEVFETDRIYEDFDHPLATNAIKLIASEFSGMFPTANRLIRIPNQKMHIDYTLIKPGSFYAQQILRLIRNGIESP